MSLIFIIFIFASIYQKKNQFKKSFLKIARYKNEICINNMYQDYFHNLDLVFY